MKHTEEFRDPAMARQFVQKLEALAPRRLRIMEVCGTHTMAIFRSGLRSLLPSTLTLLSGPGCPVCVTAQEEIDAFIALARQKEVIIATFGDLIRVPGSFSSLQKEKGQGKDIRVVYSTFDALNIARRHPDKTVVFLGVGFETTAPTIAAAILCAKQEGLKNFLVHAAHKLVPPALTALLAGGKIEIDGFLLPGHVSVVIGAKAYLPVVERFQIPCVIAGFEPLDILQALCLLLEQIQSGKAELQNAYSRAVAFNGNPKALSMLSEVFTPADAEWRGIGTIPQSGLVMRAAYAAFDARQRFDLTVPKVEAPKGCACGQILMGRSTPVECALYGKACTPATPVGPCMVSSEGTCAAYFRYHGGMEK